MESEKYNLQYGDIIQIDSPTNPELHEKILTTPGVIETGIFYEITDCALIVDNGQIEVLSK